jgi:predicted nucleic acid-binding protein
MSGFLLDTNVLSEFNRTGKPDERVKEWLTATPLPSLYVSVITLAEVQFGIELLPPSKRRADLEQWMEREFPSWFSGRILAVDEDIVRRWALFTARRQREGRPLANFDGLIAATAQQHGLTLATRDIKDFHGLGIPLFNPWDARNPGLQWPQAKKADPEPVKPQDKDLEP